MVTRNATVQNSAGIHCRPSAVIIKETEGYSGSIKVVAADGADAELNSIVGLLALGLAEGSTITITVDGPDAAQEEAMAGKLVELFERHFDFPPQDS